MFIHTLTRLLGTVRLKEGLSSNLSERCRVQVDAILEALERPTGKIMEAVFDLG